MIQYGIGKLYVSEEQKVLIEQYLVLTGEKIKASESDDQRRYVLGILEAFGNNPALAAQKWNQVLSDSLKKEEELTAKTLQQVPFPEAPSFIDKFHSPPEAKMFYKNLVSATKELRESYIQHAFYDHVDQYHRLKERCTLQ